MLLDTAPTGHTMPLLDATESYHREVARKASDMPEEVGLDMTTYVYETIPAKSGEKSRYFELRQSMKDAPLTKHPETGEPIRRVVLGGYGVLSSKPSTGDSGSSCGPGCGCH